MRQPIEGKKRPRRSSVWLLGLCLFVCAATLGFRVTVARAGAVMRGVGAALSALEHNGDGLRALTLNGARFTVRTASTRETLSSVLATHHARCAARAPHGFWKRSEAAALSGAVASLALRALTIDGVFDVQQGDEGVVACLESNAGELPPNPRETLDAAFARAVESGDLSHLGRFRYVYARAGDDGRTASLELRSEGALAPALMFPAHGDAPGMDDAELPRPHGTRRVLSVVHEERDVVSASLTGYESSRPAHELRRTYRDELRSKGLTVQELRSSTPTTSRDALPPLLVRTHTRAVLVVVSELSDAQGSWVLLLPLS